MRTVLGRRLFAALSAGIAAYCCLSLVLGPAGLLSYAALGRRLDTMRENLVRLEERNLALRAELGALSGDADRVKREARSLGWLSPGETEVVISGRAEALRAEPLTGAVLPVLLPDSLADMEAKRLALAVAVIVLLTGLFRDAAGTGRKPQRASRVQEASRV